MSLIIDQFNEDTIQLSEDLLAWLPGALPFEIAQYGKALPEEFWTQLPLFEPILITAVIEYRNARLRKYLNTNAYLVMNQLDIQEFIRALAQYNQASVIANFRQEYPDLQATPYPEPIVAWANSMVVLWNNTFYFLQYKKFVDYSVYLKSILKLHFNSDQLSEAHRETVELLDGVTKCLFNANFSTIFLPTNLAENLRTYFNALSFFPKEYCLNLIMSKDGNPLFQLLTALEYVFGVLKNITELRPLDIQNEPVVVQIVWDVLASDLEREVMLAQEEKKLEKEALTDTSFVQDNLPQKLFELFTINNIENGYCATYLHDYVGLLTPSQKDTFKVRLLTFFRNSSLMQTLLDRIDVDFFFSQIGPNGNGRSKQEFVNGLAEFVDPALWPISQKVLIMLATTM